MPLPPGPATLPAVLLWRWIRHPFELMDHCHARYGDIFKLRFFMLPQGLVVLSDPLDIKKVFALGPDEAHAGEANIVLRPFLGEHSLLSLDGAEHLRHRKMILPAFHGERMHAYGRTMMELARDSIDRWPVGRRFAVHRPMQSITLQVILRTVFGVQEGPLFSELSDVLAKELDVSSWPGLLFPVMQHDLGPLSPWGRWTRYRDRASALIRAEIRKARAAGDPSRTDVLAMMIAARDDQGRPLGEDEIHDELVTLLVAGHETTATSLAWALRWILPDPGLLRRLRAEIESAEGDPGKIAKLELLDATVKETLRLQPVVPMVGRVLHAPLEVHGWELPPGTVVAPSIYLVHRRPSLYPEPERFNPDRFSSFKPAAWEYLPFGGGLRRCVGASFAQYEMKMVLASLLPRVEMRLATDRIRVVRRSITLTPSEGLPVIVTEKRPAATARRAA
ncbi:MAG TPA: cytochrome P450 [Polyangiaceae bacterium]|nr:cytochrome P450 [Polyangiaceae bacterium]